MLGDEREQERMDSYPAFTDSQPRAAEVVESLSRAAEVVESLFRNLGFARL